ncbi:hypothetical protein ACFQT0_25445 [Hymenobacter humi]|uniref:Uncharacterized protein n=1 Tax=Hymenobacter humi TaxID=1411620 RepID=A0ABW2UAE3_9BACT
MNFMILAGSIGCSLVSSCLFLLGFGEPTVPPQASQAVPATIATAPAAPTYTVIDLMPTFWKFWAQAKGKDEATQAQLFKKLVADPHPEVYNNDVLGGGPSPKPLPKPCPPATAWCRAWCSPRWPLWSACPSKSAKTCHATKAASAKPFRT